MNNHTDLIDAFVGTREQLLAAADAVPPELRETPFVGHWSLMDLLAHLVGWDYTNLDAIEAFEAGRVPGFYRYHDPGWVSYNRQLIERYGTEDWETLREALERSQEAVVSKLRLLGAEEMTRALSEPGRRRPVTLEAILRAAIGDEREHLAQIRTLVNARRG